MKITKRAQDDIAILDFEGKLTGAVESWTLPELVLREVLDDERLSEPANRRLLLSLGGCTGADSLGLGELVSLYLSVTNRGGTLKLVNLPPLLRENLAATQLLAMFEVFDDEAAALASFGRAGST